MRKSLSNSAKIGIYIKKEKINLNIYPTPCTKVNSLSCGVKAGLREGLHSASRLASNLLCIPG